HMEVSSDLAVIAPPASPIPFPLRQYLGIQVLHLRNANWWPDFPLSAQTIEALWTLNGRQPVDGVVAVDLQTLQSVMAVVGGFDVPPYGHIAPDRLIDELFTIYERGGHIPRDRGIIGGLLGALLERIPTLNVSQLQELALALLSSLDER